MRHFLLVHDRPRGALLREQEYPTGREAMDARYAAEREFHGNEDIEVVVLISDSPETIRKTHARYFKTPAEMIREYLAAHPA